MRTNTAQSTVAETIEGDRLLDTDEVAEILGVSPRTARTWRTDNSARGPRFVKLGGAIRYRASDVQKFLRDL